MRDGAVIKQDSPKNLMTSFSMTSLEGIFLSLCEKPAEESASLTNVSRICHERQPEKKNSFSWTVLKALLSKDIINARRHFGFLTFQAVLPLLVLVLFYLSIGRNMQDIPLGIVNMDNPACTKDFETQYMLGE